jgi:hypothetical protein
VGVGVRQGGEKLLICGDKSENSGDLGGVLAERKGLGWDGIFYVLMGWWFHRCIYVQVHQDVYLRVTFIIPQSMFKNSF